MAHRLARPIAMLVAIALGASLYLFAQPRSDRLTGATGLPLPPGAAWTANPFLAEGSQLAVVAGNPQAAGAYAMRITFPERFQVMPHSHPDERIYTVIAGSFEIGLGATYDSTKFAVSAPGEVIRVPARAIHFHRATRATEFQVNGMGPTGINYIDSLADPRRTRFPK